MFVKRKPQETTTFGSLAVGAVFCWPGNPSHPLMKIVEWKDFRGLAMNAVSLTGSALTSATPGDAVVVVYGAFVEAE